VANVVSLINQPTGNDDAAVGPLLRRAALHDDGLSFGIGPMWMDSQEKFAHICQCYHC